MKLVLGAAIIAAMLALAPGPASASAATKLCKVNPLGSPCPAAKIYPSGSTFKGLGSFFIGAQDCEVEFAFETGAASGTPLPAEVVAFPFSNCPAAFTIAAVGLHWSFPISVTGTGPNGSGGLLGSGGSPIEFEVTTPGVGHCFYKFTHFPMFLTGGSWLGGSGTGSLGTGPVGCPSTVGMGFEALPVPEFFVTT